MRAFIKTPNGADMWSFEMVLVKARVDGMPIMWEVNPEGNAVLECEDHYGGTVKLLLQRRLDKEFPGCELVQLDTSGENRGQENR